MVQDKHGDSKQFTLYARTSRQITTSLESKKYLLSVFSGIIYTINFEFDPEKSNNNIKKHGSTFSTHKRADSLWMPQSSSVRQNDAISIAKRNPEFEYGTTARIEVRPIKTKEEGTGFVCPKTATRQ
jgi:hypothetical protein